MTCFECRWSKVNDLGDDLVLECRRYPPGIVMDGEGELWQSFPHMEPDQWCGEFVAEVNVGDNDVRNAR